MNLELLSLFEADQKERQDYLVFFRTADSLALQERDRERRKRVSEIIATQGLNDPEDYYHAAMIFQHGETVEEIWQAHTLAKQGAELGNLSARWLVAAALDRWLMYQGKPQKYGTQFVSDGNRYRLWDVDPTTTDAERSQWNVPSLQQQQAQAEELSQTEPIPPITDVPQRLKDAIKRW